LCRLNYRVRRSRSGSGSGSTASSLIVPTLRVGMPSRTLCVQMTRSVMRCVTTRSVGTIVPR
jgi:hypothetical protein